MVFVGFFYSKTFPHLCRPFVKVKWCNSELSKSRLVHFGSGKVSEGTFYFQRAGKTCILSLFTTRLHYSQLRSKNVCGQNVCNKDVCGKKYRTGKQLPPAASWAGPANHIPQAPRLFLLIKFHWKQATPIRLYMVSGCFCARWQK